MTKWDDAQCRDETYGNDETAEETRMSDLMMGMVCFANNEFAMLLLAGWKCQNK